MTQKRKTTIHLDSHLIEMCKKNGLNISREVSKHLELYFKYNSFSKVISGCCLCKEIGTPENNYCIAKDTDTHNSKGQIIAKYYFVCSDCYNKLLNEDIDDNWDKEIVIDLKETIEKAKAEAEIDVQDTLTLISMYGQEFGTFKHVLRDLKHPFARFTKEIGVISYLLRDVDPDIRKQEDEKRK